MNSKTAYSFVYATVIVGLLCAPGFGCGKTSPPLDSPQKTAGNISAVKTSFSEVTAQLDPGGDFYVYLGTAQWLEGLSGKVGQWQEFLSNMPGVDATEKSDIAKVFHIATRLIQQSGVEDISGIGLSSVQVEKGMFRNKAVMHHYKGKGGGFMWQLGGSQPHELAGLDYLPTDTVVAAFSDANLSIVWDVVQKEMAQCGFPQAEEAIRQLPVLFEQQTKLKWETLLTTLGGEFGFILTFDDSRKMALPIPPAMVEIPVPGMLIAIKVNDDTLFNRIDEALISNPQIIKLDKPELKMRTMRLPLPFIGELRPSTATSGGYLFISSTDALIDSALAVKSGQKPGLKASQEFKRLSRGLPDKGNQFMFMSERFVNTLANVQSLMLAEAVKQAPEQAGLLKNLFHSKPAFAYTVGYNTLEGSVSVGNCSESYSSSLLLPAVAVPGLLAAIAIPNFVKARETSQRNVCINNLRMIDAAKQQWGLEFGKKTSDTPTATDLQPYISRNGSPLPACPQGGRYSLGTLGEQPACSIADHVLN